MATTARWEQFEHGADIGVRGFGASPAQAFEQAALALTAAITQPERVEPREAVPVACDGEDLELLFTQWLNALVYEMATRRMLFGRFRVALDGPHLRAVAEGEAVDAARHQPAVEVKGATLTALRVAREPDGTWVAQCVVDV
jgi:tRNA nucleotidyltransferase (CCA-adding enzyme)